MKDDLKDYEIALNEAYQAIMEQGSPVASKIMNMAQKVGGDRFNQKKQACKKHFGFIKTFQQKERLQLMACMGRAKASSARRAASFIDKAKSKCGKEKHCKDSLDHYATNLRTFAKREESLSAGDDAKLMSLNIKKQARVKKK